MISNNLSTVRESDEKIVWPNAGILWKDAFIAHSASTSPCDPIHSDLIKLIERNKPDLRYFLSPNAAEGILRRVDSQNKHLFPHLRSALERLSGRPLHKIRNVNTLQQNEIFFPELVECV
jgi:DNA (cytosine-5)-methyltransferase 1